MANFLKTLPNALTTLRLLLIPIFAFLLFDPTSASRMSAAIIFSFAAITDFLDGLLARKFRAESDFGKLFDPLADKILVMTALVLLVGLRDERYGDSFVPAWMVVLVLAREIWITGVRGLAATRGLVLAAAQAGKYKAAFQMIAIVLLLLHERSFSVLGYKLTTQFLGLNLLMLSIFLSVVGVYDCTVAVFRKDSGEDEKVS